MLTPTLQRRDGWLVFEAVVPEPRRVDAERLLAWSGELPGGCKFARHSARAGLRVRAELPDLAESDERIARVHSGFAAAAARLDLGPAIVADEPSFPLAEAPDLAGLCRESGWPFEERGDGSVIVDLGVPGAYLPARIEARADGVAIEAEIARAAGASDVRRAALAELLLRVNAAFRLARAVLRGAEPRALLEILLPLATRAEELGESIAAIAVAARRCALEAGAVASDERIARAFLAGSGTHPPV